MKLNEKTIITEDIREIVFLGHNFYGSRVTRDDFTCSSLALFTEDPISDINLTILRLASLIYDCGYNSFYDYIRHCYMNMILFGMLCALLILCLRDFSKFDASVCAELVDVAWDILEGMYNFETADDYIDFIF